MPQIFPANRCLACSQTLHFLFKVRRARVVKYKPQGFVNRSFSHAHFSRRCFRNERKEKENNVYVQANRCLH